MVSGRVGPGGRACVLALGDGAV